MSGRSLDHPETATGQAGVDSQDAHGTSLRDDRGEHLFGGYPPAPPFRRRDAPHSPRWKDCSMGDAEQGRPEVLIVPDVAAWRQWLDVHEGSSAGVWLLLAKKGTTSP